MAVQLAPASSTFYARLGAMVVAGRPLHALPRPARRVVIRLAHSAARLRPADGSLGCNLGLALATHGEPRLAQLAYARAAILEVATAALVRAASGPLRRPLWGDADTDHTRALVRRLFDPDGGGD